MTTVGFIYPDHAAEDDYPRAARLLGDGVQLPVEHIYGTDLHAVAELRDLGSPERLAAGARLLRKHGPDAVVWACTSGSFVFGWDGARQQVEQLGATAGIPASSTSFAFLHAARRLGITRVAVAASYPEDVAGYFVNFLAAGGITVVHMGSRGIRTAAEVGQLPAEDVLRLAADNDDPEADALLIPDTAMRTVELIDAIEESIGKPVLTANQVTIWEGLRLTGGSGRVPAMGELFRSGPPDSPFAVEIPPAAQQVSAPRAAAEKR